MGEEVRQLQELFREELQAEHESNILSGGYSNGISNHPSKSGGDLLVGAFVLPCWCSDHFPLLSADAFALTRW